MSKLAISSDRFRTADRVERHVNPVVAVSMGYFFAGELVTPRMLIGTALIVASLALILIKDKT